MIVNLKTNRTTQLADPLATGAMVIALSAGKKPSEIRAEPIQDPEPEISRRRLRNRIILANTVVWIAIIVAVRLIFF